MLWRVLPRSADASDVPSAAQPAAISERISARSSSISLQAVLGLDMPEGPAVAGGRALRDRADAVDRADLVAEHDGAVGADQRAVALLGVDQFGAGRNHAALDQFGERHAGGVARGHERRQRRLGQRFDRRDARFGRFRIGLVALEADVAAAETFCHGAGGAGAVEGIDHEIAGLRRRQQHARQEALGLLGRVHLLAVGALEALFAGAKRDQPVGTRLHVLVGGLQGFVIERIALGLLVARRPDHGLMGIGEAAAAEIRHRIGLAPDDVVEDPEAEVLHDRADAENVVIGADHPQRRRRLHDAAAGQQPGAGEIVVSGEG